MICLHDPFDEDVIIFVNQILRIYSNNNGGTRIVQIDGPVLVKENLKEVLAAVKEARQNERTNYVP
jgi:hypothetical protein